MLMFDYWWESHGYSGSVWNSNLSIFDKVVVWLCRIRPDTGIEIKMNWHGLNPNLSVERYDIDWFN